MLKKEVIIKKWKNKIPELLKFNGKRKAVNRFTINRARKWIAKGEDPFGKFRLLDNEREEDILDLAILINSHIEEERESCITSLIEQSFYWEHDHPGIAEGLRVAAAMLQARGLE